MDVLYNMKREMLRRKLSPRTVNTYLQYVKQFLLNNKNKSLRELSKKDVREFLYKLEDKGLAGSSLNVAHNALRFMMIEILHKSMYLKIKFSKVPKRIPDYLTKSEVKSVLDAISNPTHNLLVSLMYGAGLRVREVTHLKVIDLSFEENIGWVRGGKGNKDRPFIIPQKLKSDLKELCVKQTYWLFPGRNGPLTVRSVQEIVKQSGKRAGLKKHVHPHIFRHSFATHLLESNESISSVQSLLGHIHPETTLGYCHGLNPSLITSKSPLD